MAVEKILLPGETKSDEISSPLTKASHRNPDIHQRGDTLPESLLEYQEGSGTLNPDVGGNTPRMERAYQTILGNSIFQALVVAQAQLGNLAASVTCPIQAGSGAFVRLKYTIQLAATFVNNFPPNFCGLYITSGGVIIPNDSTAYYQAHGFGVAGAIIIWHVSEELDIPINPGQTLNLAVAGNQALAPGTGSYDFSVNTSANRCALKTTLIY